MAGGAAACGDDDDDGDNGDTPSTEAAAGEDDGGDGGGDDDGGGDGGDDAIGAYCDAVDDFVAMSAEVMENPTDTELAQQFSDEGMALTETATQLGAEAATMDGDDAERLAECQAAATEGM